MVADYFTRGEFVHGLSSLSLPLSVSFEITVAFLSGVGCSSLNFPASDNKSVRRVHLAKKQARFFALVVVLRDRGDIHSETGLSLRECVSAYLAARVHLGL